MTHTPTVNRLRYAIMPDPVVIQAQPAVVAAEPPNPLESDETTGDNDDG